MKQKSRARKWLWEELYSSDMYSANYLLSLFQCPYILAEMSSLALFSLFPGYQPAHHCASDLVLFPIDATIPIGQIVSRPCKMLLSELMRPIIFVIGGLLYNVAPETHFAPFWGHRRPTTPKKNIVWCRQKQLLLTNFFANIQDEAVLTRSGLCCTFDAPSIWGFSRNGWGLWWMLDCLQDCSRLCNGWNAGLEYHWAVDVVMQ